MISRTVSTVATLLASQGKNVDILRSGSEYNSSVLLQTNQPGGFLSYNNLLKNRWTQRLELWPLDVDLRDCFSWDRIDWYFVLVQKLTCYVGRVLDSDAALEWIIVTHQGNIYWPRAQRPQFQIPDALHNSPLCILKRNISVLGRKSFENWHRHIAVKGQLTYGRNKTD